MAKREQNTHELMQWPLEGRKLPITIKRRSRQKYIRLRISGNGEVVVSAPKSTTKTEIKRALSGKSGWISGHLRRIEQGLEEIDPLKKLYYLGKVYPVELFETDGTRTSVRFSQRRGLFSVSIPKAGGNKGCADRACVIDALGGWLRRKASELFRLRAREISEEIDLPFKRLYIRNQRTRWGSSSSIGNISINWRAVMAPQEVQRYLIIHELAHQRHLNHSVAFWGEVGRLCPDYRSHEQWLKDHKALMALFR